MTNLQYYKDKILEVYEGYGQDIAFLYGQVKGCDEVACEECQFSKKSGEYDTRSCHHRMFDWLEQEHVGFLWSPEQIAMLKALPQDCYLERGTTTDELFLREHGCVDLVLYPSKLVIQFPQIERGMHYKVSELLAMAER